MTERQCFLCCKKATINKGEKKGDLLKNELTVFFLVNKLLKISASSCTVFLEKEGNPSSWINFCEPCSDLIRDVEHVSKKIRKLQNKRTSLVREIENYILKEYKKEAVREDQEKSFTESTDVCRSIRKEVALRLGTDKDEVQHKVKEAVGKVKSEPLDSEEDVDPDVCRSIDSWLGNLDEDSQNEHEVNGKVKSEPLDSEHEEDLDNAFPPSPPSPDNSDPEEGFLNTCISENIEYRRGRGRPRRKEIPVHHDSDQSENNLRTVNDKEIKRKRGNGSVDSSSKEKYLKSEDNIRRENENSQSKFGRSKKTTKLKVKSKMSFKCKCGKAFKTGNSLINHKRKCEKYSYTSVGTRDTRSNSLVTALNNCKSSDREKETLKSTKTSSTTFKLGQQCLCSRKLGCKHRRTVSTYKKACQTKGDDFNEKLNNLVAESEHVTAKEVGYYRCRLCRLGFKDKMVYSHHLIGGHMEHLRPPLKCKCCRKCFIIEDELNMHIESTEECKMYVEPIEVNEPTPARKNNQTKSKKKNEVVNEVASTKSNLSSSSSYDDDETTSSSSSDDYELIGEDKEVFDSGSKPAASEKSVDGLSTEESRKVNEEDISKTSLTPVAENTECSTSTEPTEKMRLFRTFRCLTCKEGFKSSVVLNSHIRGVHKAQERPFVCHICPDTYFKTLSLLGTHFVDVHEGIEMSSCPVIEGGKEEHKYRLLRQKKVPLPPKDKGQWTWTPKEKKLKKVVEEIGDPDWDPDNMEEFQPSKREPKKKTYITSDKYDPDYIYECKTCEIKYEKENYLIRHSLFSHWEEIGVCEEDLVFHCDLCNKKYSTAGLLNAHKRTVHEGKKHPFECNVCKEEFNLYKQYLDHCEGSHTMDGPVLCDICNIHFCDEQSKTIHVRKCHENDVKPHRCSLCNVGFATDMELRYHRLKHVKRSEEYMCEFCSLVFKKQNVLKRHQIKNHFEEMGVDPFKCDQCGRIYGDKYRLSQHKYDMHMEDCNFSCLQCKKGFKTEEALEKHIQIRHVEGKKFLCSECPEQYWKKSQLERHEKKAHSGEGVVYKCNECTKTKKFRSEKVLLKHMEKHSLLYKCHLCPKIFISKRYLQVHLKGVHALTKSLKAIEGYKADEETLKEVKSRSQARNSQGAPTKKKKKEKVQWKIKLKKSRQESPANTSESENSNQCDNTNSSANFNSEPLPLIVPQPQVSTTFVKPGHSSITQHYPLSSGHGFGYANNEHFMVTQDFSTSVHQTQHPNTSNYFHRNMQMPNLSFPHYPDPYQPFSQN